MTNGLALLRVTVLDDSLRQFLLAPEGNWTKGVRSIQGVARMEANVTKFIDLMEAGGPKLAAPKPKALAVPAPAAKTTAPAARLVNGQKVAPR